MQTAATTPLSAAYRLCHQCETRPHFKMSASEHFRVLHAYTLAWKDLEQLNTSQRSKRFFTLKCNSLNPLMPALFNSTLLLMFFYKEQ